MKGATYQQAGVDIAKGDRFASYIASLPSAAISKGIGSFSGGTELDLTAYRQPVILSTTDGVGTKLLVAKRLSKFDTIGIDLVAMCVNDLVVCGAKPLSFLDYIACGALNEPVLHEVIHGIVKGCEIADCLLTGGETAEMPDVYAADDFDLAGFAVGVVEKDKLLPRRDLIRPGDIIVGLPSSGVHSNGLSLARKVLGSSDAHVWELLLTPTRIYTSEVLPILEQELVAGAAHITGGGLEGNIQRALPEGMKAALTYSWTVPPIFGHIQEAGGIADEEMRLVFNMGIGIALIVPSHNVRQLLSFASERHIDAYEIGTVASI